MADNDDNNPINSLLLRSLVERRAEIEGVFMKQPLYKQLCAINFLIETEYLRVAQEGDPFGDGGDHKYHSYSEFAKIMLDTFIDGSGEPPETNSGFTIAEELARKSLEPNLTDPMNIVGNGDVVGMDLDEQYQESGQETYSWPKPRSEYIWQRQKKNRLVSLRKEHPDWTWRQIGDAMGITGPQCSSMYHAMKGRGEIKRAEVPLLEQSDQQFEEATS